MDCGLTYEKKTIKLLKYNPGDIILTSSQDGGVGTHIVPPHTTKRTATNLKTKKPPELPENQTVWKSDNQGVKETFIQLVGGVEMGSWSERTCCKVARWQLVEWEVPHLRADKLGGTTGEQDRLHNPGFQVGK